MLLSRADFSDLHAFEARQAFVKNIASGEAGINLADAALAIAAEDDALVSHSSVKLPVQAYAKRMQRMAEDIAHNRLNHLPSTGSDQNPMAVLEVWSFQNSSDPGLHLVTEAPSMTPSLSHRLLCYVLMSCCAVL